MSKTYALLFLFFFPSLFSISFQRENFPDALPSFRHFPVIAFSWGDSAAVTASASNALDTKILMPTVVRRRRLRRRLRRRRLWRRLWRRLRRHGRNLNGKTFSLQCCIVYSHSFPHKCFKPLTNASSWSVINGRRIFVMPSLGSSMVHLVRLTSTPTCCSESTTTTNKCRPDLGLVLLFPPDPRDRCV